MYLAVWQACRANQQHVDGTLYRLKVKLECHLQEHDTTQCGFAYSTADQVAYCPVQEPPIWPALLQLPEDQYSGDVLNTSSNAGDNMNMSSAPLLYTGADRATADTLMAALFARNQSLGGTVHLIHAQAVLLNCIDFVQSTSTPQIGVASCHNLRLVCCRKHICWLQSLFRLMGIVYLCKQLPPWGMLVAINP